MNHELDALKQIEWELHHRAGSEIPLERTRPEVVVLLKTIKQALKNYEILTQKLKLLYEMKEPKYTYTDFMRLEIEIKVMVGVKHE